jgi:hypothetical protein
MSTDTSQQYSVIGAYDRHAARIAVDESGVLAMADGLLYHARQLLNGEIQAGNVHAVVLSILFGRVLSGVHGAIVLRRTGLPVEANTVLRSAMEAGFRLGAIALRPELLEDYLGEGPGARERAISDLEALRDAGSPLHPSITNEKMVKVRRDIDRERQECIRRSSKPKLRTRGVFDWAREANQIDLFHAKYLMLSQAAHHSVRDLERSMVIPSDGVIKALRFAPVTIDLSLAIADAMVILARAVEAFATAMDRAVPPAFEAGYAGVKAIHARAAADFDEARS